MTRPSTTRQTVLEASTASSSRSSVQTQVHARPVDFIPASKPYDSELDGLIKGLQSFQPALEKYAERVDETDRVAGEADRLAGTPLDNDQSRAYIGGYNSMDGAVKGMADANALATAYQSEFNKDLPPAELDKFLSDKRTKQVAGVQDNTYMASYNKAVAPVLQKLRTDHLDYTRTQVVQRAEGNATALLDTGVRSSLQAGAEVPEESLTDIRSKLAAMGIGEGRFNELLFDTVRKIGTETGSEKVFDVFKRPRQDGSQGLYFAPEWKAKIDQAQIQASQAFFENARKADALAQRDRDNRQEEALFSVFLEDDPKKASSMFREHVQRGLFTRASDLIKWEKHLTEKVDGRPNLVQLERETGLLASVYQGSTSVRQIINDGGITSGQRKFLLGELRKTQHENRTASAAESAAGKAIYKTPEFKSGDDYIEQVLRPNTSSIDPYGQGTEFERQQRATARLEFTQRAATAKHPSELNAIREEIVERYQKRRKDFAGKDRGNFGAGLLRYTSPKEAADAARRGEVGPEELAVHLRYFKEQTRPKVAAQ